jgi:hypothetical protein
VVAGVAAIFVVAVLLAMSFLGGEGTPKETAASEPPAQTAPHETTTSNPVTEPVQDVSASAESQNELNSEDYALVPEPQTKAITPADRAVDIAKDTRKDPAVKSPAAPVVDAAKSPKAVKDVRNDVVTATKASPLNPSTLVIYSDKGKISKRVESTNAALKASNSSGATRPRVVANPKP